MVKLTELPCEIITMILEQGRVRDIQAAVLSCHYINSCFNQHRSLAGRVILRQIPERLLVYALGAATADRMPKNRTQATVRNLIDRLHPAWTKVVIDTILQLVHLRVLVKIEELHNIVHSMALDYANEAWDFIQTTNMTVPNPGTLQLSQNEYLRFCRAFYRVEIRHSIQRPEEPAGPFRPRSWNEDLLAPLPSYDREQMGCVLEYQERLFLNSVRDVLAHDVAMGHIGVDYVNAHEDYVIQSWLAQGLRFLVKVTGNLSYDQKKSLLCSKYGPGDPVHLWKSLDMTRSFLDIDRQLADDHWIQEKDGTIVHAHRDSVDVMDLDCGPRTAFACSIAGPTPIDGTDYDGFRDRAYVLWDMDTLSKLETGWAWTIPTGGSNTFHIFVDEPMPTRVPIFGEWEAAEKTLVKTLEARKEVWDKGGSGYWSADDLSKVIWGGQRWAPHAYPEY